MEVDAGAVLERLGIFEQRYLDFKLLRWLEDAGRSQMSCRAQALPFARRQGSALYAVRRWPALRRCREPARRERGPAYAKERLLLPLLVSLCLPGRFSSDQCSSNDCAKTFHGKHAVNRQTEERFGIPRWDFGGEADDFTFQFVETCTCERADGDDRRAADIEKRSAQEIFNLHAHNAERVGIHQVSSWLLP